MNYLRFFASLLTVLSSIGIVNGSTLLPTFNSSDFINGTVIDNPYRPFLSDHIYTYEGENEDGETETIRLEVTDLAKNILGIDCTVVLDTVWIDDIMVEETYDWFAQDKSGNIWYMGEWSTEYKYDDDGLLIGSNNHGSWEAGVDGALPGYWMPANHSAGDKYYLEYYIGEAEDEAEVVGVSETLTTAYGTFENCLKIFETTILDPEALEYKYYTKGLGYIKVEDLDENGNVIASCDLIDVQVVPEPATISLMTISCLAIIRRHNRKILNR